MKIARKDALRLLLLAALSALLANLSYDLITTKRLYSSSIKSYPDPTDFRYEHFGQNSPAMANTLKKLFPKGTRKSYIDNILVKHAGAKVRHKKNGHSTYIKRRSLSNLNPDMINFEFDQSGNAVKLIYAGEVLY